MAKTKQLNGDKPELKTIEIPVNGTKATLVIDAAGVPYVSVADLLGIAEAIKSQALNLAVATPPQAPEILSE